MIKVFVVTACFGEVTVGVYSSKGKAERCIASYCKSSDNILDLEEFELSIDEYTLNKKY